MRMTYVRKGRTGGCKLVVRAGRGESLDFRQADALKATDEQCLVRLEEAQRTQARRPRLQYDVSNYQTLRRYLRGTRLTTASLLQFLNDLLDVIAWCTRSGMGSMGLLLDTRYVFVSQDDSLRFVSVPLRNVECRRRGSPLGLVEEIADGAHVRFAGAEDAALATRLWNYARRANDVFSANELRAFVCREERHAQARLSTRIELSLPARQRALALEEGRDYLLGRGERCALRLRDNPLLSRAHARVRVAAGGVVVRDCGSTNGTTANGVRVGREEEVFVPVGGSFALAGEVFNVQKGV